MFLFSETNTVWRLLQSLSYGVPSSSGWLRYRWTLGKKDVLLSRYLFFVLGRFCFLWLFFCRMEVFTLQSRYKRKIENVASKVACQSPATAQYRTWLVKIEAGRGSPSYLLRWFPGCPSKVLRSHHLVIVLAKTCEISGCWSPNAAPFLSSTVQAWPWILKCSKIPRC